LIIALVRIIDGDIESGKLQISGQRLEEYLKHTKHVRIKEGQKL